MLLLMGSVGVGSANRPEDVNTVHAKLMDIGKIPCYRCSGKFDEEIKKGIVSVQRHFMARPDGSIAVNGPTHKFLDKWQEKPISPGVVLSGKLKDAWRLVSPVLPTGSYCASAYRSTNDQRRILHNYFRDILKAKITAKYGQKKFDEVDSDLLANEAEVVTMVRGVGQAIAPPGKSQHEQGKAIDVGGRSSIDREQVRIISLVARANPLLLSGYVIQEQNGCVHFEIR